MDQVVQWSSEVPDVKNHAKILKEQEVTGKTLLTLTEDKLRSIGFPLGPATLLSMAIEALKPEKTAGFRQSRCVMRLKLISQGCGSTSPPRLRFSPLYVP